MALLAANVRWLLEYRVLFDGESGGRTDAAGGAARIAREVAARIGSLPDGTRLVAGVTGNPSARMTRRNVFLFPTRYTLQVSVAVLNPTRPVETRTIDAVIGEAVKACGNPTFSANRIRDAFPEDSGCTTLSVTTGVISVCREHQQLSSSRSSLPPLPTTISNSVGSTAGSTNVQGSTTATEIGSAAPGVGAVAAQGAADAGRRIRDEGGSLWGDVPLTWKIGGGVLLGIVAFAAIGYGVRSFRVGVG